MKVLPRRPESFASRSPYVFDLVSLNKDALINKALSARHVFSRSGGTHRSKPYLLLRKGEHMKKFAVLLAVMALALMAFVSRPVRSQLQLQKNKLVRNANTIP